MFTRQTVIAKQGIFMNLLAHLKVIVLLHHIYSIFDNSAVAQFVEC